MIWIASSRRPAHAYGGPTSQRSLCGMAPLLDHPAGEYAESGRIRRKAEPADPFLACLTKWHGRAA